MAIRERLAKSDPNNAGWQRDLTVSHNEIGDVLVAQGDLPGALESYRASMEIAQRLAKSDPNNAVWQRDLAVSNERLGEIHVRQGQTARAITAFEGALEAYKQLLERNPDDIQSRVFSVVPLVRLGTLKGKEGREHLVAALEILRPLAEANRLDATRRGWIDAIEAMLAGAE
jgi:tetratricopeptide (TPR) repeat protein